MVTKPLVMTIGDPKGIGIEIAAKAWRERKPMTLPAFFLLGNMDIIYSYLENRDFDVQLQEISTPGEATAVFNNALPVLPLGETKDIEEQIVQSISRGAQYCMDEEASGLVTNPIQKKRLYDAGFDFPGHTEYLANLTNATDKAVMMLACRELKVVPATIHVPLKEVPARLTPDLLTHVVTTVHGDMQTRFGIKNSRIVVAGLNPHAGEEGSIGTEDRDIIAPVINKLQQIGIDVSGPFPADSLFHKSAREKYDLAICMYHDQALIPIKTIDFYGGVNVTLGLPIIRTSPDHGTAEGIFGKGIANPNSLISALKMAASMAAHTHE
jgi:4-hydroxythreonine-4-phosphate dehydrogenase